MIAGERVRSIEPSGFKVPPGARMIDLSERYVLPVLIDCDTNLTIRADSSHEIDSFTRTPFDAAIAGVVNAKTTLESGFTTVRDVGSIAFLAVDLRRNIDAGYIPGPRVAS